MTKGRNETLNLTEQPDREPRYWIETDVTPEGYPALGPPLTATYRGHLTAGQFRKHFPGQLLQHHMCLQGTDADGRRHLYTAADVLECESRGNAEPSHQAVMAQAMIQLAGEPAPSMAEIRRRCRGYESIPPEALVHLLETANGGWEPDRMIADQFAQLAMAEGLTAADYLTSP